MNKKRVKQLKKQFEEMYGRKANPALYNTDGRVSKADEFRKFKKQHNDCQMIGN